MLRLLADENFDLELQLAFGLRAREAMQLRPHFADQGTYLSITHGTKGGRARVEPIRTPEQRALLDLAKTFCATRSSSTSDPQRKLGWNRSARRSGARDWRALQERPAA